MLLMYGLTSCVSNAFTLQISLVVIVGLYLMEQLDYEAVYAFK